MRGFLLAANQWGGVSKVYPLHNPQAYPITIL
ncbi:hypothetical protein phi9181_ORF065 [Enterococcus phage 9181]|nr:hypothetical protein phi9181_ORF065 [Enterococcus phage 9181]